MSKKILALILSVAMVCSLCVVPALAAETQSVTFADAQNNWAESSINRWAAAGIVTGDEQGNFNPGKNLRRCELATILVRLLGLTETARANTFSDVAVGDWYADAILKCAAAGIMEGWNGKADPLKPITREQAITMVGRALGVKPKAGQGLDRFTDAGQVSAYAAEYMAPLTAMGILSGVGDGTKVAPKNYIDRASAMALLDKAIASYVTTPGSVKADDANKFVIVNATAGDVTLSGTTAGVLITNGNKANVKLNGLTADTVKVDAPVAVSAANNTTVGSMDVNAPATVTVDHNSKVGDIDTTDAPSAKVEADTTRPSSGGGGGGGGGSTATTYTVTVDANIVNGSVRVNKTKVTMNTVVTVTVTPAEGYELDALTVTGKSGATVTVTKVAKNSASGGGVGGGGGSAVAIVPEQYTFTMPGENVTVSATFKALPVEATYTVTVDTAVNGTVTADKTSAKAGETVTLTVAPATGYELDVLTVDGAAVTVTGDTYAFEMPAKDVTVSATFKSTTPVTTADYTLDIDAVATGLLNGAITASGWANELNGSNKIIVSSGAPLATGTDNMFTIYPKSGGDSDFRAAAKDLPFNYTPEYRLVFGGNASLGNDKTSPVNCVAFTTDGAVTVTVYWQGGGSGTRNMVILNAEGGEAAVSAETATAGTDVFTSTMELTASGTYYLGGKGGTNHIYKVEVNGKLTVPGSEQPGDEPVYNVTVDTAIVNGTVTPDKTSAKAGETVTLTVTPATNYEVKTVTVDGKALTAAAGKYTFEMPAKDVTVSATFEEKTIVTPPATEYTVTVSAATNGTVTASVSKAEAGAEVTLTVTPDSGYELDTLTVKDASNADVSVTGNKFTMPASNVTVAATFKATVTTPETVTLTLDTAGANADAVKSVSLKGVEGTTVEKGAQVTIVVEFDDGKSADEYTVTCDTVTFTANSEKTAVEGAYTANATVTLTITVVKKAEDAALVKVED